jgi:hypothetical protein
MFAVRVKAELIRSLKVLINIKVTALNNKTRHSIPLLHYSQQVTFGFPFILPPNCSILRRQHPVVTADKSDSNFFHTFLPFTPWCSRWSIATNSAIGFF